MEMYLVMKYPVPVLVDHATNSVKVRSWPRERRGCKLNSSVINGYFASGQDGVLSLARRYSHKTMQGRRDAGPRAEHDC